MNKWFNMTSLNICFWSVSINAKQKFWGVPHPLHACDFLTTDRSSKAVILMKLTKKFATIVSSLKVTSATKQ